MTSLKAFSLKSYSEVLGVRDSTHELWGNTVQPITRAVAPEEAGPCLRPQHPSLQCVLGPPQLPQPLGAGLWHPLGLCGVLLHDGEWPHSSVPDWRIRHVVK